MKFFYILVLLCEFFISFNAAVYAKPVDYDVVIYEVLDELSYSEVIEAQKQAKIFSLEALKIGDEVDFSRYYRRIHDLALAVGVLAIESDAYDSFDKILNSGLPHHAIVQFPEPKGFSSSIGEFFLYQAIETEKINFVERLIDWGVDLNKSGQFENFLFQAALKKNEEIVQLLLEKGAMQEKIEKTEIMEEISRLEKIYEKEKIYMMFFWGVEAVVGLKIFFRESLSKIFRHLESRNRSPYARLNFLIGASVGTIAVGGLLNMLAKFSSKNTYENLKDLKSKKEEAFQLINSVSKTIKPTYEKSMNNHLEVEISRLMNL